jgi:hypothetical protein
MTESGTGTSVGGAIAGTGAKGSGGSGAVSGTGARGGTVASGGIVASFGATGGTGATGGGLVLQYGGSGGGLCAVGGAAGAAGAPSQCVTGFYEYIVCLPPEGTPAEPGQICSATMDPVDSNRAARVTLTWGADFQTAQGFVAIDPALEPRIIGLPIIEELDTNDPFLQGMQVSMITKQAGGFSFLATWPAPIRYAYYGDGYSRLTIRVTLELRCDPNPSRMVHAVTDIHLCDGDQGIVWVSSGDRCTVCRIIAEMAPSPIVPDKQADDLPLARAMRLRIVELARISNSLVLLAENDGGEGLEYEWHVSAGRLEQLAPDVVVWTLEQGMPDPLIQTAVWGEHSAAVASFAFNEAAA